MRAEIRCSGESEREADRSASRRILRYKSPGHPPYRSGERGAGPGATATSRWCGDCCDPRISSPPVDSGQGHHGPVGTQRTQAARRATDRVPRKGFAGRLASPFRSLSSTVIQSGTSRESHPHAERRCMRHSDKVEAGFRKVKIAQGPSFLLPKGRRLNGLHRQTRRGPTAIARLMDQEKGRADRNVRQDLQS